MKKFFLVAIISLVSILCVSATVSNSDATVSGNHSSSVTATVAGIDESFDFDTKMLVAVYNLMPQKVKKLCVASFNDIAPRIEKSGSRGFTYAGVRITPIKKAGGIDLKFSYNGHTVVVKNYTKSEFDNIFGF